VNLGTGLFLGWLGSASLRYYDEYKEDHASFFSTVLFGWAGMGILVLIGTYLLGLFTKEIPILAYFPYIALLTFSLSYIRIFEKILRASRKTSFYIFIILLQNIVNLVAFYLFVTLGNRQNAEAVMAANVLSQLLVLIAVSIKLQLFTHVSFKKISKEINKRFLYYGFPMMGVWGVGWILSYSD